MTIDSVRKLCLSFPHATENVQWGNDLVFKIAGKMFAVLALDPGPHCLSFKVTAEEFADLTEIAGIAPAPYLARAHWVSLETFRALSDPDLQRFLRQSYNLVVAKLPKKTRSTLA